MPASASSSNGFELFGFVSFTREHPGAEATDFEARADYTDDTADANPDWKLDLRDEEIGAWRGPQGRVGQITLVWGDALVANGALATAELGPTTTDQCELADNRFTLISLDNYTGDLLAVRLWGARRRRDRVGVAVRRGLLRPGSAAAGSGWFRLVVFADPNSATSYSPHCGGAACCAACRRRDRGNRRRGPALAAARSPRANARRPAAAERVRAEQACASSSTASPLFRTVGSLAKRYGVPVVTPPERRVNHPGLVTGCASCGQTPHSRSRSARCSSLRCSMRARRPSTTTTARFPPTAESGLRRGASTRVTCDPASRTTA